MIRRNDCVDTDIRKVGLVVKLFTLSLVVLCLLPSISEAYNFLYIHPTTGEPLKWDGTDTIKYYLDPGPSDNPTSDQVHTLLKEAMKIWENASPDANVPKFEFAGWLPEDVNGTNYQAYASLSSCYVSDLESCATEAQKAIETVIVFDDDGSIRSNELCRITACAAVAGARVFSGSSSDPGNIVQGIAVFGGISPDLLSSVSIVDATMDVMVHELGHLLGLAHSYLNQQGFGEGEPYYPTMMASSMLISGDATTLSPDDIAGISALYPSDTLATDKATIKGQILKSDVSPMMWVSVIARNVDDPLCESYSWLSGRTCPDGLVSYPENNITGGTCYSGGVFTPTGNFSISGLHPGT